MQRKAVSLLLVVACVAYCMPVSVLAQVSSTMAPRTIFSAANQYGAMQVLSVDNPDSRTSTEVSTFTALNGQTMVTTNDPSAGVVSTDLPGGRIVYQIADDGSMIATLSSKCGQRWVARLGADGQPSTDDDAAAMQTGLAALGPDSLAVAQAAEAFGLQTGLLTRTPDGLIAPNSGPNISWGCAAAVVGLAASYSSIFACATGVGCLLFVAAHAVAVMAFAEACS